MKKIFFAFCLFSATAIFAQEKSLKEQALDEFKNEHYSEAIALMERALEKSPNEAEIIPLGNIDRVWYVKFLKNGLKNSVKKINMNLTDNQISDIHPFK